MWERRRVLVWEELGGASVCQFSCGLSGGVVPKSMCGGTWDREGLLEREGGTCGGFSAGGSVRGALTSTGCEAVSGPGSGVSAFNLEILSSSKVSMHTQGIITHCMHNPKPASVPSRPASSSQLPSSPISTVL